MHPQLLPFLHPDTSNPLTFYMFPHIPPPIHLPHIPSTFSAPPWSLSPLWITLNSHSTQDGILPSSKSTRKLSTWTMWQQNSNNLELVSWERAPIVRVALALFSNLDSEWILKKHNGLGSHL